MHAHKAFSHSHSALSLKVSFLVLNALVHPPASTPSGGHSLGHGLSLLLSSPAPLGAGSPSHRLYFD